MWRSSQLFAISGVRCYLSVCTDTLPCLCIEIDLQKFNNWTSVESSLLEMQLFWLIDLVPAEKVSNLPRLVYRGSS